MGNHRLLLWSALVALAACGVGTVGCGYKLVRYGDAAERKQIALHTLDNASTEPGVELLVSEALRREVLQRHGLRIATRDDAADYVLRGRVREVSVRTTTQSSAVLALEHNVTLELDLALESPDGQRIALPHKALVESETFLASADIEALRKNRREALRRVAEVLAARIHDRLDAEIMR